MIKSPANAQTEKSMRSAIYYPHTELRSPFLLSTSLLLWDKVRFIVPYPGYRPGYQNEDFAKAIEIIGEQHFPSDAEKRQAHEFIEDFVTRPLPKSFLFREPEGSPYNAEFRIFQDKLFLDTWDLLDAAKLAGKPLQDFGVPVSQLCGLSLMSMLADCCAGSTHARVTDRSAAYANVVGLLANHAEGLIEEPNQPHEQLVPISLNVINTEAVDIKRLIDFREREEKSAGHAIRDLRHRYIGGLEKYAVAVGEVYNNKADQKEILRQFETDMKDDIAALRDELRLAKQEAFVTKEIIATVVTGIASFMGPHFGIPAELTSTIAAAGVPTGAIFGSLSARNKYQTSRKSILEKHPMAYMYELERLN